MNILMISVPCTLLGVLVGAIYSLKVGKELDQDPEYLKRVANHEFSTEHYEAKGVENQMKAALSVSIFVLATIAIVNFWFYGVPTSGLYRRHGKGLDADVTYY